MYFSQHVCQKKKNEYESIPSHWKLHNDITQFIIDNIENINFPEHIDYNPEIKFDSVNTIDIYKINDKKYLCRINFMYFYYNPKYLNLVIEI